MEIKDLLQLAIDRKASDLHLLNGLPPFMRIEGELSPIPASSPLTQAEIGDLLKGILNADQLARLGKNHEIDLSLPFSEKARFRANIYTQAGTYAAAFRVIPLSIPTLDQLNLPPILHSFTTLKQGLVLITGPTGHGKSTTLAAILNEINKNRACHIVTIEDPVEFIIHPDKAIISQREMYIDTNSWAIALRSVLREDPDVVLVGEMRDVETMAAALTVAETGHLVFATLHTNSASQAVDRIVDVFPEDSKGQVRMQLSNVLEAVFSMRLVSGMTGGRFPAYELMLATSAIKTTIRDGKTHQIDTIIQTSQEIGMIPLENSLAALVRAGKITVETAQEWALRPEDLNRLIRV